MASRRFHSRPPAYRAPSGFGEQPWIDDPVVSPVFLRGIAADAVWELTREAIGQRVDCSARYSLMWRISKQLSRILRRDAEDEGIQYDPAGWADLGEIRAFLAGAIGKRVHLDMICSVARFSDKGRF